MYFTLTPDDVNLMCNSTSNEPWEDTKIGLDFDVSVKRYLSGFLIVLLWTRFTFDVARDPGKKTEMFNKYSLMYQRVASSFLKLLIIYACFIISFCVISMQSWNDRMEYNHLCITLHINKHY